jgi:feruloyl-CoA synthase
LRARFIAHFAPLVRDVVLAGPDRDEVVALIFPDLDACRALAPDLPTDTPAAVLVADPRVRNAFSRNLTTLARKSTGTSNRIGRAVLLADPPSLDVGEVTDKGSINQRAVLDHRAASVEELYAAAPPSYVIVANVAATSTAKKAN